MLKPTLVIIGSGWGAYSLTQNVDLTRYKVKVISPERTLQYTPLLASAACGHFDFRLAEEPIRRQHRTSLEYYKAAAKGIDFEKRVVTCIPCIDWLSPSDLGSKQFSVAYNYLVLAPGCDVQTFDTPGVMEHAHFLRSTNDARLLQQRLLEMMDAASLPGISEERQREILHIRIVGGGAIGIEAVAELYDLWAEAMRHLYPHLDGKVQMSVHDVAPRVLSNFDRSLGEYAMRSLKEKNVVMKTGSHIEKVESDAIYTKEDGRLAYGLLLWATGTKANALLEHLEVKKTEEGMPRILTNKYLQVLNPDGSIMSRTFALGDAAQVEGQALPTLAEVALQKGEYLTAFLNAQRGEPWQPFIYKPGASVAYLGGGKGVRGGNGSTELLGEAAWIAWRSGSLRWTRSWRRKLLIVISWMFMWLNGRDIARL